MQWSRINEMPCSVARTLAIIGERWTLLIIRDCFYGVERFDDFQKRLGVTRHVLADRLKKLTSEGILERQRYQTRPERYAYQLTEKGRDLYPILMTLVHWGDKWMAGEEGVPVEYIHDTCQRPMHAVVHCSECDEPVQYDVVTPRRGPGMTSFVENSEVAPASPTCTGK